MATSRNRLRLLAGMSTAVLALTAVAVVQATNLNPGHEGVSWNDPAFPSECPDGPLSEGDVLWHFVLTNAASKPVTLTATFASLGEIHVLDDGRPTVTAHFDVVTPQDTLLTASTNVEGNTLALSYICVGDQVPQPSFEPTSTPSGGGTPPGENISVSPAENGRPTPHQVTFESVSAPGSTTVTTSATGPELPAGFQLGTPPRYYDLQTTATISGSITVCLSYAGVTPAPTALLHFEGGAWVDITISGVLGPDTICGVTTSLSPFAAVSRSTSIVGFFPPLNDPISATNPMSVFKAGSTVPVKLELRHGDGSPFSNAEAGAVASACALRISLVRTAAGAPAIDEAVNSTQPHAGSCFRHAGGNALLFNLSTKGLSKPATYEVTATLYGEGTSVLASHSLAIGLR